MKDITYSNLVESSLPYNKPNEKQCSFGVPKFTKNDQNILIANEEVYKRLYGTENEKFNLLIKLYDTQNHFNDKVKIDSNFKMKNFKYNFLDCKSPNYCNLPYTSLYLKPSSQKLISNIDTKFLIKVKNIFNYSDTRTTCMVKNIPNRYTQTMLIDLLNEHHYGCFDFVYLRMDFKNKCNVGYAFVNFTSCIYVAEFYIKISNMKWRNFSSNKIAELTYASVQGYDSLVKKFRNSAVMKERISYRPKVFYRDGHLKGQENSEGI